MGIIFFIIFNIIQIGVAAKYISQTLPLTAVRSFKTVRLVFWREGNWINLKMKYIKAPLVQFRSMSDVSNDRGMPSESIGKAQIFNRTPAAQGPSMVIASPENRKDKTNKKDGGFYRNGGAEDEEIQIVYEPKDQEGSSRLNRTISKEPFQRVSSLQKSQEITSDIFRLEWPRNYNQILLSLALMIVFGLGVSRFLVISDAPSFLRFFNCLILISLFLWVLVKFLSTDVGSRSLYAFGVGTILAASILLVLGFYASFIWYETTPDLKI